MHATLGIAQLEREPGARSTRTGRPTPRTVASVAERQTSPARRSTTATSTRIDIDTGGQAFSYLRFSWSSNSQGFVLSSLETERMPGNHTESFGYTMSDADGDLSSSMLTVTPGTSSGTQIATLDGTAGDDYLVGDARDNMINRQRQQRPARSATPATTRSTAAPDTTCSTAAPATMRSTAAAAATS